MTTPGDDGFRRHRLLLVAATAMTALLLTSGGIVCVTESGRGCPDWPRCYGRMVPPMRIDAMIEYSHRVLAGLTSPLIIAAAFFGQTRFRASPWVSRPPVVAIPLLCAVVVLGALAVLRGIPPWAAVIDVGSALIVLALLLASAIVASWRRDDGTLGDRLSLNRGFTRVAVLGAASLFTLLVTGVLVADSGSTVRCFGCLVARPGAGGGASRVWIQMGRDALAGVVGLSIVGLWMAARRRGPLDQRIRRATTIAGALLVGQIVVSALVMTRGAAPWLLIASVATAVAAWMSLVALVVLSGLSVVEVAEAP